MLEMLIIPAAFGACCLGLLMIAWDYTRPVRQKRRETIERLRREYGNEYAKYWEENT